MAFFGARVFDPNVKMQKLTSESRHWTDRHRLKSFHLINHEYLSYFNPIPHRDGGMGETAPLVYFVL